MLHAPRKPHLLLACAATLLTVLSSGVAAQGRGGADTMPRFNIRFYHGVPGQATVITPDGVSHEPGDVIRLALPAGNEVCVRVINAHTGHYTYAGTSVIDSSAVNLLPADITKLIGLLAGPLGIAATEGGAAGDERPVAVSADRDSLSRVIFNYSKNVHALGAQVAQVQTWIKESDRPAEFRDGRLVVEDGRDFQHVRTRMQAQRSDEGWGNAWNFLSDTLTKDVDGGYSRAVEAVNALTAAGSDDRRVATNALQALRALGRSLATTISGIRQLYERDPDVRICRAVGKGTQTTFSFTAQPRDTSSAVRAALVRDTGAVVRVHARVRYERPLIELMPVAFGFRSDADEYAIQNDTLRRVDQDHTGWRTGGMLLVNGPNIGALWNSAPGVGFGFGVGGEGQLLSDGFISLMWSVRDQLRLGVGYGQSSLPSTLVSQSSLNQPTDANDVSELVKKDWEGSWFVVLNILGLKVKSPF